MKRVEKQKKLHHFMQSWRQCNLYVTQRVVWCRWLGRYFSAKHLNVNGKSSIRAERLPFYMDLNWSFTQNLTHMLYYNNNIPVGKLFKKNSLRFYWKSAANLNFRLPFVLYRDNLAFLLKVDSWFFAQQSFFSLNHNKENKKRIRRSAFDFQ